MRILALLRKVWRHLTVRDSDTTVGFSDSAGKPDSAEVSDSVGYADSVGKADSAWNSDSVGISDSAWFSDSVGDSDSDEFSDIYSVGNSAGVGKLDSPGVRDSDSETVQKPDTPAEIRLILLAVDIHATAYQNSMNLAYDRIMLRQLQLMDEYNLRYGPNWLDHN